MGETTLVLWACPICSYSFKADADIAHCPRCNSSRIERDSMPDSVQPAERERIDRLRRDAGPLGSAACMLDHAVQSNWEGVTLTHAEAVAVLSILRPAPVAEGEREPVGFVLEYREEPHYTIRRLFFWPHEADEMRADADSYRKLGWDHVEIVPLYALHAPTEREPATGMERQHIRNILARAEAEETPGSWVHDRLIWICRSLLAELEQAEAEGSEG